MIEDVKKERRSQEEMDKIRELAEDSFIRLGMNGRQISKLHDVSEQTISGWRRDGNWDDRRDTAKLTPVAIKELLLEEARKEIAGEKSALNFDRISKIMSAIDRVDKTVNSRVVMAVLQQLDNFTADIDPEHAIKATGYHKQFLQHIIRTESKA